jgi:PAS domain S-box-containing protein
MRRSAALLDEVDIGVVAADTDGRVTHWNRGAEALYGWTREEAIGQPALELMAPADPALASEMRGATEREGAWTGTLKVRRKDGSALDARVRDTVLRSGDGSPAGTVVVSAVASGQFAAARATLASRE